MRNESPTYEDDKIPKDYLHLVYICMLMAGIGYLTPWVSYVGAIDYFFYYYLMEFPAVSVILPITYFGSTLAACSLNLLLVVVLGTHSRIMFSYILFVISLSTVLLLDVALHNCLIPTAVSFYITLLSVCMVGLGSGGEMSIYRDGKFL